VGLSFHRGEPGLGEALLARFLGDVGDGGRRGFVEDGPEEAELFDGFDEFLEIDRLDHISVHAELIAPYKVLFFAGGGEHDDGDAFEEGILAHLAKHFEAVHLRHFQIEQDHGWEGIGMVGELSAAVKVIEGFGTVARDNDFVRQMLFIEGGEGEFDVPLAVFNEQYSLERGHVARSLQGEFAGGKLSDAAVNCPSGRST
jgi:hypothetical protein